MNTGKKWLVGFCMLVGTHLCAQQVALEGYVYESNNRGFLKNVKVMIIGDDDKTVYLDTITNKKGLFTGTLPLGKNFTLIADKKHFFQKEISLTTVFGDSIQQRVYTKVELERKPGYVFDVTMAQAGDNLLIQESIQGARIEVYNNTTSEEELTLNNYPYPNFKFTFENGNHYTIMIRKKGFFTKRVEAYVNVEGCILCFDGLGMVDPGVTDVMTDENKQGTFLANVELQPAEVNTTFRIENIYYDYNKYNIRTDAAEELDKLVTVIKDNPAIKLEMGSHTDARGSSTYNMGLSEKRAASAVDYLVDKGIDPENLTHKGYGETVISNRCTNGVTCSDDEHEKNRRTELKIVGIEEEDPLDKKSLKEIIQEEKLMNEVRNSPVIKITDKGT